MSKIFDDIKNELSSFRDGLDHKQASDAELLEQRVESDRALLVASGIHQIFEEIRDSGLVILRPLPPRKVGRINKLLKGKQVQENLYVPAQIIDSKMHIALRFDEKPDSCSEVRIAAIGGKLNIAHGYSRVDYTMIEEGKLKEAVIDGLKNPLRISSGY